MDKFVKIAQSTIFLAILTFANGCSDRHFKPFLAHDSKTGEYLGVVISECRNWDSKKVIGYKIQLKDGSEVEKSPDSITINPP